MKRFILFVMTLAFVAGGATVASANCGKCKAGAKGYAKGGGYFLNQLPEAKEMAYHKAMRKLRQKNMALKKEMAKLKPKMMAVFTAEKFNKKEFDALKSKYIQLKSKKMDNKRKVIGDLAKQFNAQERQVLMHVLLSKGGGHGKVGCQTCSVGQKCSQCKGKTLCPSCKAKSKK